MKVQRTSTITLTMRLCLLLLVLTSLLIVGCSQPAGETLPETAQEQVEAPLTDDQLLAQYPDSLDEALQDLDQVE